MPKAPQRAYASATARATAENSAFSATYLKVPEGMKLFKPKVGVYKIDILPYEVQQDNVNPYAQAGNLFYERTFYIHRNIGPARDSYLCPAMSFGEGGAAPCPICEKRMEFLGQSDKASVDLAKALKPSQRQLFNIIDLKDPNSGIQLWEYAYHNFGVLLDKRLRSADESAGWENFFHLEDGLTLSVTFDEETGDAGRKYVQASAIDFQPRKRPYGDDMLDEVAILDDQLIEPSAEKLEQLVSGTAPSRVVAEAEQEEQTLPVARTARRTPAVREDAPDPEPEDNEAPPEEEPAPVAARRGVRRAAPPVVEEEVNETEQPAEEVEVEQEAPATRRVARRAAPVEDPPLDDPEPPPVPARRRVATPEPEPESAPVGRRVARRSAPPVEDPEPDPAPVATRRAAAPAKDPDNWGEFENPGKRVRRT